MCLLPLEIPSPAQVLRTNRTHFTHISRTCTCRCPNTLPNGESPNCDSTVGRATRILLFYFSAVLGCPQEDKLTEALIIMCLVGRLDVVLVSHLRMQGFQDL